MKMMLIQQLVSVLLSMLTPELMRSAIDRILDIAEDAARDSKTPVDDAIVLPLCMQIRKAFDIPDND